MIITDGKAKTEIDSDILRADQSTRDKLQNLLIDQFRGEMLSGFKQYDLFGPEIVHINADGLKEYVLEAKAGHYEFKGRGVDFSFHDKNGNPIADTKRDRIRKKKKLSDLISRHQSDKVLRSILKSCESSRSDQSNEFIYLYEILEAVSSKFKDKKKMQSTLKISNSDLNYFGRLCNHEPLQQGRHRGDSCGTSRDATNAELSKARSIAKSMIEAYIGYIERDTHESCM